MCIWLVFIQYYHWWCTEPWTWNPVDCNTHRGLQACSNICHISIPRPFHQNWTRSASHVLMSLTRRFSYWQLCYRVTGHLTVRCISKTKSLMTYVASHSQIIFNKESPQLIYIRTKGLLPCYSFTSHNVILVVMQMLTMSCVVVCFRVSWLFIVTLNLIRKMLA
jgi:hypothetical protein